MPPLLLIDAIIIACFFWCWCHYFIFIFSPLSLLFTLYTPMPCLSLFDAIRHYADAIDAYFRERIHALPFFTRYAAAIAVITSAFWCWYAAADATPCYYYAIVAEDIIHSSLMPFHWLPLLLYHFIISLSLIIGHWYWYCHLVYYYISLHSHWHYCWFWHAYCHHASHAIAAFTRHIIGHHADAGWLFTAGWHG